MAAAMVEEEILRAFEAESVSPCITVPCKHMARFLEMLAGVPERKLIYPAREEEGLGIYVGAYLAGAFPVMIIQNSGFGTLPNAYCSLAQFYEIPMFFLLSYRGEGSEPVPAQMKMGVVTSPLLELVGIETHLLERPSQVSEVHDHLRAFKKEKKSRALLARPGFWKG